ncbi:hypothetical protein PRZ48_007052 [Zasmidium cellare]|uniref:Heterokaryon incompatibility domain-containing protein n=1 Tax=Zasmidium cellare TaxID=395010 RepID=A0ABR0EIB5_ZASCE|nr:hypothetical protein PRZ48_007052 [Zasmidium cellare]
MDIESNEATPICYASIGIDPGREIRILELLPGDFDDVVCCKLTKQALETEPEQPTHESEVGGSDLMYEAISYAWGSQKDVVPIQLVGSDAFFVTRNLRAALKRLRKQDLARRLWADQICINQRNIPERNEQVAMMWTIFNQAARVIVWLGEPSSPPCKLPAKLVKNLGQTPYADEMRYLIGHHSLYSLGSWWTRSWVVQEFASARTEPVMYFGPYFLDWAVFRDEFWDQRMGSWHWSGLPKASFSVLSMGERLAHLRELSHRGQATILSLDWALLQTECSDPRDKLYSLLGLLSRVERDAITVDYAKDTLETFTIATQALLAANQSYGVLNLITSARRSSQLPTWVLDFSLPTNHMVLGDSQFRSRLPESFASEPEPWLNKQSCTALTARYEPLDKGLTITGLSFDRVIGAVPLEPPVARNGVSRNLLAEMLRRFWYLRIRHREYMKHFSSALRNANPYESLSTKTASGRRAAAQGPATAKEHDLVILPYGSRHPMLLRPQGEHVYTYQSFLNVFGIMDGELLKDYPDLELEEMDFKIL